MLTRVLQDFGGLSASDWVAGRASRAATERLLEAATGCRVAAFAGTEALGSGEIAYGSGRDVPGLVLMAGLGANGFGAALFEDGVLVHNVDVRSVLASWHVEGAPGPPPPEAGLPEWSAWAERVDRLLLQLDSLLRPSLIIIGGSAARAGSGAERLIGLLTVAERTPCVAARLSVTATVKGAAWGAAQEFRTRDALAAVRAALGAGAGEPLGSTPAELSPDQLRSVFDRFASPADTIDDSGGGSLVPGPPSSSLSLAALGDMLRALSVTVDGRAGLLRVFAELADLPSPVSDDPLLGSISWESWSSWWASNVKPEAVQLLLSQEEFDTVLRSEPEGRLICLEVGMTYCRPCKTFEKAYKGVAASLPAVKFLRINGNENRSCTALARDALGVRSTPAFYFFRGKGPPTPVATHTGANEERLRAAISSLLAPPAVETAADESSAAAADAAASSNGAAPADTAAGRSAVAAASAVLIPPVVALDAGKIDTRGAVASGLASALTDLAAKQRALDKARAAGKAADAALVAAQVAANAAVASIAAAANDVREAQERLAATTGVRKTSPL